MARPQSVVCVERAGGADGRRAVDVDRDGVRFRRGDFWQSSRTAGGVLAGTDPGQTSLFVDPDADGAGIDAVPGAARSVVVRRVRRESALGEIIRFFVGNGTADRPDAGLLWGQGFSLYRRHLPRHHGVQRRLAAESWATVALASTAAAAVRPGWFGERR